MIRSGRCPRVVFKRTRMVFYAFLRNRLFADASDFPLFVAKRFSARIPIGNKRVRFYHHYSEILSASGSNPTLSAIFPLPAKLQYCLCWRLFHHIRHRGFQNLVRKQHDWVLALVLMNRAVLEYRHENTRSMPSSPLATKTLLSDG